MEYIDLKDFLKRLLDNWLIIVLCCIIGVTSAFIYTSFFTKPVYSSTVKVGVYNSDWSNKSSTMSDIQASVGLIETCLVVLQDDVTAETVSQTLKEESGIDISAAKVKASLSFAQHKESQWLNVVAKTDDPELAAMLCNAVAAKAPELLSESVPSIDFKCLGQAKVNYTPVSPNLVMNLAIGFFAALVVVCLIIFLIEFFDNTIRDESKLEEKYGLGILGVVPNIYNISRADKYRYKYKNKKRGAAYYKGKYSGSTKY